MPSWQVERFLESWITGQNGITYTPGGMAWASQWASNRFVGNAAMIAAVYASHIQGISPSTTSLLPCFHCKHISGSLMTCYHGHLLIVAVCIVCSAATWA
jgi:hypothetical protein